MKPILLIIISINLLSLLASCKENKSKKILQELQGDWVSTVDDKLFISIRDSSYFHGDQYEEFEPLFFRNDSIFTKVGYLFLSDARFTDKYMWGFNEEMAKETPGWMTTRSYHNANIKLKSLEVRFINFWQRGLWDWALYMDENLDCFLKVEGKGRYYKKIVPLRYSEASYYSKLSPADFEFYQEKFRNIPLSKIKEKYESDIYYPGMTCLGPTDNSKVLLICEFSVGEYGKTKSIEFEVRGFYDTLPGYLAAFIFHLNKIHDFINFEKTDKLYSFRFYSPDYNDSFLNTASLEEH